MEKRFFKRPGKDVKKVALAKARLNPDQQKRSFSTPWTHAPFFRSHLPRFNPRVLIQTITFVLLLLVYVTAQVVQWIGKKSLVPQKIKAGVGKPLQVVYVSALRFLNVHKVGSISRVALIELSIRNMKAKKARTVITIGGMAIGFGAIVFLVSMGYGLEQLVVSRIASLDEMKQADVSIQPGSKVKINDKTLADFKQTPHVVMALPLIAVVGRVNFQNSVSDMAVYGVTSDYLKQSAIQPIQGKIFESNELAMEDKSTKGQVAGVSTTQDEQEAKSGEKIQNVEFAIEPGAWVRVREAPAPSAKILGYTKRLEGNQQGEELWGETYLSEDASGEAGRDVEGKKLGKWVKAPISLWDKKQCEQNTSDCENGSYMVLRDADNKQVQKVGYFAQLSMSVTDTLVQDSQVLGVTTNSDELEATDSASFDFVEIPSEAGIIKPSETKKISLGPNAQKQAIVNRAMLEILGIKEGEAVGKAFSASFIATGDLLDNQNEKIESMPAEYTIVGVTPDAQTPVFYVPFVDLRSLGITNYSQVKVVVSDQKDLTHARKQVEALGYTTRSVADTVSQINSLFATARTILALLGVVALGVAALGMFNTLTVSLLERTREVGLMKAMGMKSYEVKELFLTESMLMGFFGGVLGLIVGFLGGKLAGLLLSIFAIYKGVGYIDISYIPPSFVLIILILSLTVGLLTGIYPARRATKISALNALRYE